MHFGMCVLHSDGHLYSQNSAPKEWPRDKKRLQRAGANWVRIGPLTQDGFLLVCEPVAIERRVYSDRAEAVRRLGCALAALVADPRGCPGTRFRPVASSPGWRKPKKVRRYERVGWVSVADPTAVVDRLKGLGIEPDSIKTRSGTEAQLWEVVFDCPPHKKLMVENALTGAQLVLGGVPLSPLQPKKSIQEG